MRMSSNMLGTVGSQGASIHKSVTGIGSLNIDHGMFCQSFGQNWGANVGGNI